MSILNYISKKGPFLLSAIVLLSFLHSCGIYAPSDARKVSPNSKERVKKNLEEGRGMSLKKMVTEEVPETTNLQVRIPCGEQL